MQKNPRLLTRNDLIRILSKLNDLDRKIITLLQENGPMTRDEIVKHLNVPRTTVYDHLVKMMLSGIIEKYSISKKKRGRPKVFYRVTS